MLKTDGLEFWSQEMEVAITPVFAILDELMKNMDIGGEVPTNMEDYTLSSNIVLLENNWEG